MENEKLVAASEALRMVKRGQAIGLGTGSTAEIFIGLLAEKNKRERLGLSCIATSLASERQARRLGLKLSGFGELNSIDIAFDGADQVDGGKNLIKGLGGALVREKIVDYRAKKFVVMVGENKLVRTLSGVVPVEVIPLAEEAVKRELLGMGAKKVEARRDRGKKFLSDNGNMILHAHFGKIFNPKGLEQEINAIPGVVDNGIFTSKNVAVVVGRKDGSASAR